MPIFSQRFEKVNDQIQSESFVEPASPKKKSDRFKLDAHIFIDVAIILACTLAIFGRSLTNYFLADDFGELQYCWRILGGDLNLLLENFSGNYMQIQGMSVYRPFLLLSLMFDFLLWRGNSFGYYLTNVTFYFFDAVLLYLIVLKLAPSKKILDNRLTALFAAALFAVSPLHCESVSWVVGRVDIVCATFYLLSIYLMLHTLEHRSRKLTGAAIACFMSALLVKEMAIGIPVLAFGLRFLNEEKATPIFARFKNALTFSLPYLAATAVYFVVRYLCLGTLVGGYVAGFGANQEANLLSRWFDLDTIKRFAFPLVLNQFTGEKSIAMGLTALYVVTGTVVLLRLIAGALPVRFFAFLFLWALTTLAPIYKLWGLGFHLEGARFVFFLTLPLSALFAACLFQDTSRTENRRYRQAFLLVSSLVAVSSLAVYLFTAVKTNSIWINAGKQVRATNVEATRILLQDNGKTAVFLGIPRERLGTHMILNGDTFTTVINPPFAPSPPKRKFAVLEPIMYAAVHDFDAPRFRQLADTGAEIFVWNLPKLKFEPINFQGADGTRFSFDGHIENIGPIKQSHQSFTVSPASQAAEPQLILNNLHLNPLSCDYLAVEMQLKNPQSSASYPLRASWTGPDGIAQEECFVEETAGATKDIQTVLLPLSKRWTWYAKPTVENIKLSLPNSDMEVKSLAFKTEGSVSPLLSFSRSKPSETGAFFLPPGGDELLIDASAVDGCAALEMEIGKCNYFFDSFRSGNSADAVQTVIPAKMGADRKAKLPLKRSVFKEKGYYQIRARALDEDKKPIQTFSSCLTLKVLD